MVTSTPEPSEAEQRLFHAELVRFELSRGYRPGWTRRTYADRFGASPPIEWAGDLPAPYIRPETYAWIRGKLAAYAKARETAPARRPRRKTSRSAPRDFHELSNMEAQARIREWRAAGATELDLVRMTDWELEDVRRVLRTGAVHQAR
jgi:hypothetical protein